MGSSLKQVGICTVLLAIGAGAGWASSHLFREDPQPHGQTPTIASVETPILYRETQDSPRVVTPAQHRANFIAAAVEKVGSAVVRIDSSRTVSSTSSDARQNPFRRFFGDDSTPQQPQERVEQGTGSGFILTSAGRLLTNAHVVEGASVVTVTLKDGRSFDGKVIGIDQITDIAAIKIDATGLPTVKIGNSERLVPGQWAIAIGNPLGLDNTVTAGIISATGRSSSQVGIPDRRVRFIQTDAAINPGNSGGPLLNDQGEVVGINTAIRANAQGLGFAIPIETAWRIAQQLFEKGRAEHPYLGIQMVDLTSDLRNRLNQEKNLGLTVTETQGVLIIQVMQGTPAAAAGLHPGDIITQINSVPVTTSSDVQEQIEKSRVGNVISVEVHRKRELKVIQVRPTAFPANQAG